MSQYEPEKTPYLDNFHAVSYLSNKKQKATFPFVFRLEALQVLRFHLVRVRSRAQVKLHVQKIGRDALN